LPVKELDMPVSRRAFFAHGAAVAGSAAAGLSLLGRAAHGSAAGDDYRALVCVLLAGGADSFNMLVPRDPARHADYAALRTNLALERESLLPLAGTGGRFGLHPALAEVRDLFEAGYAAFLANVGTLVEPVDPATFSVDTARVPLGLFSHADQIAQWQTALPRVRGGTGVAGRLADLLTPTLPEMPVSMNVSLAGDNLFQTGTRVTSYSVEAQHGARQVAGYDPNDPDSALVTRALDALLAQDYQDAFRRAYAGRLRRAIDVGGTVRAALAEAPALSTPFPSDPFAASLRQIARLISVRQRLGARRQTFFVTYGGWDHHDALLSRQAEMLPVLSAGLGSFQAALVELGVHHRVTTFTISDFGRTLTSNGRGSDHGWGGHQLVMGGAVAGGRVYGDYPDLVAGNPLDVGRGRYVPTTSVDAYYAELALWLGVAPADLDRVLPNVRRFLVPESGVRPIGLMT
jgi:uncharacterized protein (DUF1501 family)